MKTGNDPLRELESIMKRLRAPDGCPWDRAQTHQSLMPCLMEECAELMDAAVDQDDAGLKEELGDLLMHVMLNSVMAEERGAFTLDDVARDVSEKMIRRHPHVFGDQSARSAGEVVGLWEQVKKTEKGHLRKSILDGIPNHCPALLQAEKMQKKAAKVGFDWSSQAQILEKLDEEIREVHEAFSSDDQAHIDEEIGDTLFVLANLTRFRKRDSAEMILARANAKFQRRFRYVERVLLERGSSLEEATLEEMEALWQEAKRQEKALV